MNKHILHYSKISFFIFVFVILTLGSCGRRGGGNGQLVGVKDRPKWKGVNPYGMVYIKSGNFTAGPGDEDISNSFISRPKSVSVNGFYMDETEVSNNEYRQFTNWVADSIAHILLGDVYENDRGEEVIDWDFDVDWEDESLDEMYYQGEDMIQGKRELNKEALLYKYDYYDLKSAATDRTNSPRGSFIVEKEVKIWPDEFCWIRDFSYSYNEPMTMAYFSHPAYDDYPVVGINWEQASAFCQWRTDLWNSNEDVKLFESFQLPTEHEWEYAARGGHQLTPYPWGGPGLRNAKGCPMANFKPGRGNYAEDGGQYTVKVDAYDPNDYGLFNMAGNVSEWTSSSFHENAYSFVHDLNPDLKYNASEDDPEALKRKVIRGGSWKDIGYFLRSGVRDWEYQDSARSFIGFRCTLPFIGRSIDDFN